MKFVLFKIHTAFRYNLILKNQMNDFLEMKALPEALPPQLKILLTEIKKVLSGRAI